MSSPIDLVAANRALVRQWFELLNAGRLEEAAAMTDLDGSVWIPRTRSEISFRQWFETYGRMVGERFRDGLRFELGEVTAEEDRLSVLADGVGKKRSGGDYRNHYHFYLEADGSRITRVREYADTLYASEAFS